MQHDISSRNAKSELDWNHGRSISHRSETKGIAERAIWFLVALLCILSVTTDHGEEQEMGLGERFVRGSIWRTILRGPRPPSTVCPRESERSSTVSTKGPGGLNQGRPPHQQSVKSRASKGFAKPAVSLPSVSPDERVAEARARVARLEAALQVLGETSPEAQPIQEVLRKAREQCRVQPVGERLDSTLKCSSKDRGPGSRRSKSTSPANSLFYNKLWRVWKGCATKQPAVCREPMPPWSKTDGRRGPRRRGSEVEGESGEEGSDGARSASDVMLTLIDAADSTLREVRST